MVGIARCAVRTPRSVPTGYGFGEAEIFGEAAGAGEPLTFFAPIGPSFTICASSVPSAFFQYEPLASSFSVISFIVAVFEAFVMTVLSVTLKTRDSFFPVIVNVFALWSTAAIIPWNGNGRVPVFAGEIDGAGVV